MHIFWLDSPKSAAEELEAEAPDGSFACRTGRHMIGHVDDFCALQQQLLEGKVVICKMEAALQSSTESHDLPEVSIKIWFKMKGWCDTRGTDNTEIWIYFNRAGSLKWRTCLNVCVLQMKCYSRAVSLSLQGYVRNLHASTKTLKQILEETSSLLRMFWRAALPSTDASAQQLKKVRGHLESKHFCYHNKSWKHYLLLCSCCMWHHMWNSHQQQQKIISGMLLYLIKPLIKTILNVSYWCNAKGFFFF